MSADPINPKQVFAPALGDSENSAAISKHIEQHIGKIDLVFRERVSDAVQIDIQRVPATAERPFITLVTSGMSDTPMRAPEVCAHFQYAELMICLPPDWPMEPERWKNDESAYWPIRCLKTLARFPHAFETWLWYGHSIPNGHPALPFAKDTKLSCMLLLPPVTAPLAFRRLEINPATTVHFFALIPLYEEETALKLKQGVDALERRFEAQQVTEVLDVRRPNVAKRGWLGRLFGR